MWGVAGGPNFYIPLPVVEEAMILWSPNAVCMLSKGPYGILKLQTPFLPKILAAEVPVHILAYSLVNSGICVLTATAAFSFHKVP